MNVSGAVRGAGDASTLLKSTIYSLYFFNRVHFSSLKDNQEFWHRHCTAETVEFMPADVLLNVKLV